jgi:phage-related protein
MAWAVLFLDERVEAEMQDQPKDIRARFDHIKQLLAESGPVHLPPNYIKHIGGQLWELRIKGKDGIARAFFVTAAGQRLVILRVFTKKTQKTPPREIELARKRAEEVM